MIYVIDKPPRISVAPVEVASSHRLAAGLSRDCVVLLLRIGGLR